VGQAAQDAWRSLLAAQALIADRIDRDLGEAADMSLAEFEVLDHLAGAENHTIRMNELATLVRLSPSGLTRRFDTLVRRGLVTREACENDRRGINARLTDLGLQQHSIASVVHDRGVATYLESNLEPVDLANLQAIGTLLAEANRRPDTSRDTSGQDRATAQSA